MSIQALIDSNVNGFYIWGFFPGTGLLGLTGSSGTIDGLSIHWFMDSYHGQTFDNTPVVGARALLWFR